MSTGQSAGGAGGGPGRGGGRKRAGTAKLQEKLAAKAAKQAKIAEKAQQVVERKVAEAERQKRIAAKATRRRDRLEAISERFDGVDIWTRVPPGSRRPRFTREAIASAAVRIADTEGIDALSMRRLATELGAGTMTLYHYVHTKDELLALVTDAVMAEVVLPDDVTLPADWRAAITVIAKRSKATLERHLWLFDIRENPAFGPSGVRHFDQTLEALASLDVSFEDKMDIALVVDEYVFGHVLHSRSSAVTEDPGLARRMIAYVESLLATGQYPQLSELAASVGMQAAWNRMERHGTDPGRFDRNLGRLLDGIESDLRAR